LRPALFERAALLLSRSILFRIVEPTSTGQITPTRPRQIGASPKLGYFDPLKTLGGDLGLCKSLPIGQTGAWPLLERVSANDEGRGTTTKSSWNTGWIGSAVIIDVCHDAYLDRQDLLLQFAVMADEVQMPRTNKLIARSSTAPLAQVVHIKHFLDVTEPAAFGQDV
jgi:hypothetical protein